MSEIAWVVFLCAALLEVSGDALIRRGLRSHGVGLIIMGFVILGCYGLVVNAVQSWDFSKLIGVYVAIFAAVSILTGRYLFKETIPAATWAGLTMIVIGGLVIQFGRK